MNTKLKSFFVLLSVMLGGVSSVWAKEVYTVTSDGSTINTTSGTASFAQSASYQATASVSIYVGSGWNIGTGALTGSSAATYVSSGSDIPWTKDNDNDNTSNLPDKGAYLTFTASQSGKLTINGTKNGKSGNKYLIISSAVGTYVQNAVVKFNGGNDILYTGNRYGYSLPTMNTSSYSTDSKEPFTAEFSVSSGTTYYVFIQSGYKDWSFTGFTFLPTAPDINSLEVNTSDQLYPAETNATTTYRLAVNGITQLSYDSRNSRTRFRTKLNLGADLDDQFKTTEYFSVTSSDETVISTSNFAIYPINNAANRAYVVLDIVGVGEATLTFTFTYGNGQTRTASQAFTIVDVPTYKGVYPFTWNFKDNDWISSRVQMGNAGNSAWIENNTEFRNASATVDANNGIDIIDGLSFSNLSVSTTENKANGSLCLDYTNTAIWLNGSVTVPSLTADNIVTFTAPNGNLDITVGGVALTKTVVDNKDVFTYKCTANGDVTFAMSGKHIYSIAVTEALKDNVTFDYVDANGKLLNEIDKPVEGNEVTHVFSDNGMVRLTAACASNNYNTVEFEKGKTSKTNVKWQQGAYMAVSSDKAVIRKVVFTFETKSSAGNVSLSTDGGSGTANTTDGTYTWTGESSFVKFQAVNNNAEKLTSVYVEYVERTPLTRFSPMGGTTTTFAYDSAKPSPNSTLIIEPNTTTLSAGTSAFEVVFTSNREVMSVTAGMEASSIGTGDNTNRVAFYNGVTRGVPGTADVYYRYKGNSSYAGKLEVVTYTITKADQTLTFAVNSKSVDYTANGTVTNNTLTHTGDGAVSYKSSDENVATVASDGTVTMLNSGVTTITATAKETDLYNAATASYTLTVTGDGGYVVDNLTWDETNFTIPSEIAYGNHANIRATTTAEGKTVKYRSSDESVATVSIIDYDISGTSYPVCQINPVAKGTVTITAYVEGEDNKNPKEITTSDITIHGTTFGVQFRSLEGYVTQGKTITPFVKVPNGVWSDFTSVTVTTTDASIAKVSAGENGTAGSSAPLTTENGGIKTEGGLLKAIYPTIHGVAVGTTTITLTLESTKYETTTITYTIHVTNSDKNFDWATLGDGQTTVTEYTLYTGDYMMVPAIAGTANGNWDYSKGTTCETKQAYLYGMRANSPIWNNADFKLGGGYPNYRLTDSNTALTEGQKTSMTNAIDEAYILWASSQKSDEDTLMVYGHTKGVVWLHAFDSQTGAELAPIKITILDKAEKLVYSTASYVSTMSYPYTWDFTTNFAVTATPNYWEPVYRNGTLSYYTCGYSTMFNWDYCDQDNDENINEALGNTSANSDENKYFVGANSDTGMAGVMPQFYGLTIYSGNSGDTNTKSYESKRDKLRIEAFRQEGLPRLDVVGGVHRIRLPNAATVMPGQETFKLVVKAVPTGDKCTIYKFKNGDHATSGQGTATWKEITGESIVMFDVNATEISGDNYIELGVDNVKIYWIAMTTEAKTINPAAGATGDNIEMMASYSYYKAMDYAKSAEVNGVDAYVASGLTWNDQARNLTVTMQKNNTQVPTRTGVVLRAQNKASSKILRFTADNNKKRTNTSADKDVFGDATNGDFYVGANKKGWTSVEPCNTTVGDVTFAKRLNLEGVSADGRRYVLFHVNGPTSLSIVCQSLGTAGTLKVYAGSAENLSTSAPTIGDISVTTTAEAKTIEYSGSGDNIILYSSTDTPIVIYGVVATDKGTSAYMIADAQNEAGYTAPYAPTSNHLLSTWATGEERPTLYRNAGNATGTTSGETHIPFIFSDRYTKTSTGNQHHDAGYFSFWRIKSNQITAGKNMAYIVLDKATYGNAANANGKADDITATMNSSDSRMAIRFVDDDDPFGDLTGISVVESEGVSESATQQGDGYYYDLRGRRVDTPVRGLYIHNGRKVLVK